MTIERRINLVDFEWSHDGDFVIRNGDISDTYNSTARCLIQEVEDRVKSSYQEWKLLSDRGSNLDEFHGKTNNERTWKEIESAIDFSLTKDGYLSRSDFKVTAAPISNSEVAVRIDFNTSLTNVIPDSKIVVKVVYDLAGQGPFIIR